MIQERLRQGVYVKDVAAELGVHPRTVSRARQRGAPAGRRPAARHSKLDAYKPEVDRLLAAGVWNAVVILRELQQRGYSGQVSILRDYIRPKRPLRQTRATVRFETAAGEQLQNDWAQYRTLVGGREQEVHFAVNTLGYSRRFHFVAMACEDAEHTYESLIQSFEYFGGVTAEVALVATTEIAPGSDGTPSIQCRPSSSCCKASCARIAPRPDIPFAARGNFRRFRSTRSVRGVRR